MSTYWDAFLEEFGAKRYEISLSDILGEYHEWLQRKINTGERVFSAPPATKN